MSSIEKPVSPPIGVPFSEKDALSKILARDREKFLAAGGKVEEVDSQKWTPRDRMARASGMAGLSALDQFLLGSE
jgi:hypothetical protein